MVEADEEGGLGFERGAGEVVGDVGEGFGGEGPREEEVVYYGWDVVGGFEDGASGRFYGCGVGFSGRGGRRLVDGKDGDGRKILTFPL